MICLLNVPNKFHSKILSQCKFIQISQCKLYLVKILKLNPKTINRYHLQIYYLLPFFIFRHPLMVLNYFKLIESL